MSEPCPECMQHLLDNFSAMVHAASSVGIERGLSTQETLHAYYRDFHAKGHTKVLTPDSQV